MNSREMGDDNIVDDNVLGATIFFAYIAAALLLTGFLTWNLMHTYQRRTTSNVRHVNGHGSVPGNPDRKIKTAAAMAGLSFATLSYHMLHFLIQSHRRWKSSKEQPFFSETYNTSHSALGSLEKIKGHRIWEWAKESTLFEDFGRAICGDPRSFWWTHLVLVYSFGWNLYMSVEGTRLQIPHLWVYFVLDQILPVSFTQNLFVLATAVQVWPLQSPEWQPSGSYTQAMVTLSYLASLTTARFTVDTPWFMSTLLISRTLLLAPFLLLRPTPQPPQPMKLQRNGLLMEIWFKYHHSILVVVVGGIVMQIVHTLAILPALVPVAAINNHPATSALSYDFLLGVLSLCLCNMT